LASLPWLSPPLFFDHYHLRYKGELTPAGRFTSSSSGHIIATGKILAIVGIALAAIIIYILGKVEFQEQPHGQH
jgi:hypothetical protein